MLRSRLQGTEGCAALGRGLLVVALMLLAVAAGAELDEEARDPFESWNRQVHSFNMTMDEYVVEPAARGYVAVVPGPLRRRVANFFSNLRLPVSALGGLLQGDLRKAATDTSRFAFNSTIGLAGTFDPATAMGMEHQQEDIGQALERWGWRDSPYLVLPFLGPTTMVELPDRLASNLAGPVILDDYWHDYMWVLTVLNSRSQLLDASGALAGLSSDSYVLMREAYLERRRYLFHDGDPPVDDEFDDFFGDDF